MYVPVTQISPFIESMSALRLSTLRFALLASSFALLASSLASSAVLCVFLFCSSRFSVITKLQLKFAQL